MRLSRRIVLTSLLILFFSLPLFAQTLTVKVPQGNVRAGPGTTHEVVGTVRQDEKYEAKAQEGDWFKVLLESGREGWVLKSLVEVSGRRTIGVVPSPPRPASELYGQSFAVVIGVSAYQNPSLRLHYAVNDAESVRAALRRLGFPASNILYLTDGRATGRAIRTAFNGLIQRTSPKDRVFFFFAGHGVTLDRPGGGQMGYLLPVEADPGNIVGTGVPMSEVRDLAGLLPAKHVFFAVDACFSGLLAARSVPRPETRADPAYLARGRLRQVLTAGERDQPVLEEGGHGLFTKRLLEALEGEADNSPRDGVLTAMEVAAFVQGRVIASSNSRQTPFFGTMEGVGQFVFSAPGLGPGQPDLARERAGLEEERRRLDVEKAGLERERLAAERKQLEEERKRVEEERKRIAAAGAGVPPRPDVGAGLSLPSAKAGGPGPQPPARPEEPRVAVAPGVPHEIGSGLDAMVLIPAGWFLMGSNDGDSDEKPQRRVYLDAFYIDKYPVTNARFRRFGKPKYDFGEKFNGDKQPVVGVTWHQADGYCNSVGKRLPTEAEWEKAARGVDGRRYPWGNDWDESKVIWSKNSGRRTHAVDRSYNTHRSPYGAVDMPGNVWQWVADWYDKDYYRSAPERNPKGPASGTTRVVRGGSWVDGDPLDFRAAFRSKDFPVPWSGHKRSFRCAKAP